MGKKRQTNQGTQNPNNMLMSFLGSQYSRLGTKDVENLFRDVPTEKIENKTPRKVCSLQ